MNQPFSSDIESQVLVYWSTLFENQKIREQTSEFQNYVDFMA